MENRKINPFLFWTKVFNTIYRFTYNTITYVPAYSILNNRVEI